LLPPFYKNFNKRLIKSPKLYFYDSGLVCALLNIRSAEQLSTHYHYGAIFEGFVITEIIKSYCNQGYTMPVYFWRDSAGHKVDCLFEKNNALMAVEIKAGKTFNTHFLQGLTKWQTITG